MKLLGKEKLDCFVKQYADSRKWIKCWIADVEDATWKSPAEVKDRYPSASILAENIYIFNVRGHNYRLVTHIAFKTQILLIKWIGTHAEYDKLNFE